MLVILSGAKNPVSSRCCCLPLIAPLDRASDSPAAPIPAAVPARALPSRPRRARGRSPPGAAARAAATPAPRRAANARTAPPAARPSRANRQVPGQFRCLGIAEEHRGHRRRKRQHVCSLVFAEKCPIQPPQRRIVRQQHVDLALQPTAARAARRNRPNPAADRPTLRHVFALPSIPRRGSRVIMRTSMLLETASFAAPTDQYRTRHPERSLSQFDRERRSRRACPEPVEGTCHPAGRSETFRAFGRRPRLPGPDYPSAVRRK